MSFGPPTPSHTMKAQNTDTTTGSTAGAITHSPLPWAATKTYKGALSDKWNAFDFQIQAADGFCPGLVFSDGTKNRGVSEANAAYIVKSANAFPQLVAFVRELSEAQEPTDVASYIESARAILASLA